MGFFNLQKGEKIVWEARPLPGLKWLLLLPSLFMALLLVGFLLFISLVSRRFDAPLLITSGITVFMLVLGYIVAELMYRQEQYWVTSRRIIHKTGLIGYKVYSIPLERVSDAIISRSFIESIFGIASVHIQSLAGQVTYGARFGAEGRLRAVKDPEGLQELIFDLIQKNRKSRRLSF